MKILGKFLNAIQIVLANPQYDLTQSCTCQEHRVKLNVITMQENNLCPENSHLHILPCHYVFSADCDAKILEDAKSKNYSLIHFHFYMKCEHFVCNFNTIIVIKQYSHIEGFNPDNFRKFFFSEQLLCAKNILPDCGRSE